MSTEHPKLFISYCWSSPEHQDWVLSLVIKLRKAGVDVIFDKWDLKEGHDSNKFMEKMVDDPEIKKVAIICDKQYMEKANSRSGGVGTETQIITPKIYSKHNQEKFVAIVVEKDNEGKPYLPTYCQSRVYIDLSEKDTYAEEYEKLLRWIYDEPLNIKPDLGEKPAFLTEKTSISLGTTTIYEHAMKAVRANLSYSKGAVGEYFEKFSQNLERFRLEENDDIEIDERVINNIEQFLPYRDEIANLFLVLAKYQDTLESWKQAHRFFETLLPYLERPHVVGRYSDWNMDNFRFIINELFLYLIASLLKHECFEGVSNMLQQHYYRRNHVSSMVSFCRFNNSLSSLDHRKKRLKSRSPSIKSDLLRTRANMENITFDDIMQADFVLFVRTKLDVYIHGTTQSTWWPDTLVFSEDYKPFEIFARCQSTKYFNDVIQIFSLNSKEQLDDLIKDFNDRVIEIPSWNFKTFSPSKLMDYDRISTLH